MITKEEILDIQKEWGDGVVKIGTLRGKRKECEKFTEAFIDNMYAYDYNKVLFKPTKCKVEQFRSTKEKALSYFIAGDGCCCTEDKGFALNPWVDVRFENHEIVIEDDRAFAMGDYYFTDIEGSETMVEYTFGYKKINGNIKIDIHHSSLPYSG